MAGMAKRLRAIDSRYLFLFFFMPFFVDQFAFGSLAKPMSCLFLTCLGCLGSDILFNGLRHRVWTFPLSGVVTSCGTFIILWSPYHWPYFLAGALATYSKHFVTFRGRHIFNPTSFGIGLSLYFLKDYAQSGGGAFSGLGFLIPYIYAVGILLAFAAGRLTLSLTYIVSYFVLSLAIFLVSPEHLLFTATTAFSLFAFFMITDPKTTPRSVKGQIVFALSLTALDGIFKQFRVLNSQIYALMFLNFIYLAVLPTWRELRRRPAGKVSAVDQPIAQSN